MESWIGDEHGPLVGTNLTIGGRGSFEFLRIADNGQSGISYYAMPNGRAATEFVMSAQTENRVEFENPDHDFPQRITYWREGATLHARIEGNAGGETNAIDWTFRSAQPGEGCGS